MNTVAIIHARMGSTRLPGKVLMPVLDKPLLWHIVNRLRHVQNIFNIIIATSNQTQDTEIREFCIHYDIPVFSGDEHDVLDRFYQAAKEHDATEVIRITGDCPLIDPGVITELIRVFRSQKLDFCGVATGAGVAAEHGINRFPDGLDAEIMKYKVLKKAWDEARLPYEREHVTPYIWQRPERFKIGTIYAQGRDYSRYRWTVDNHKDYELICWIYEKMYPENQDFEYTDIVDLFDRFPEMMDKNRQYIGREGYEQFKT